MWGPMEERKKQVRIRETNFYKQGTFAFPNHYITHRAGATHVLILFAYNTAYIAPAHPLTCAWTDTTATRTQVVIRGLSPGRPLRCLCLWLARSSLCRLSTSDQLMVQLMAHPEHPSPTWLQGGWDREGRGILTA